MRKITIIVALLALSPLARAQMSGSLSGDFFRTGPALPQTRIATVYNATNFPSIFPTPTVTIYACTTGTLLGHPCKYTSVGGPLGAFANIASDAPNCGELIISDDTADGYSETYTTNQVPAPISDGVSCPAGTEVMWQSVGAASLAAQGIKLTPANISTYQPFMTQINWSCTIAACKATPVVSGGDGADGLILDGIEIALSGTNDSGGIALGTGGNASNWGNHFWGSRLYIHGPSNYSTLIHNLFSNDWFFVSLSDSLLDFNIETLADGGNTYSEAHDFFQGNSNGPVNLVNNTFGGCSTENVFFGGTTAQALGVWPKDIFVFKNSFWKDFNNSTCLTTGAVKNIFEQKKGLRVSIIGNEFQYSWASAANGGQQFANCLAFNVAASSAADYTSEVSDQLLAYNVVQHCAWPSSMQGSSVDSFFTNLPVSSLFGWHDNLYQDIGLNWSYMPGNCQQATAASTDGAGNLTFSIPSTSQFGTNAGNPVLALGFTPSTFNVFMDNTNQAPVLNTSVRVTLAGSAQSASVLGMVCPSQSNIAHTGVGVSPAFTLNVPNGLPGGQLPATAGVISGGVETLTFATDPALPTGSYPSIGFAVGCNVRVLGFTPSAFNVTFGSPATFVSSIDNPANTISFPTTAGNATASVTGTVQCTNPKPGPFNVTYANNAIYGSLPIAGYNLASSGVIGANGETFATFNDQKGVGGGTAANGIFPFLTWTNNVFVVDQDSPQTSGSQSIGTLQGNGALPNFCASGNVAVDPGGNYFINFLTSPPTGCNTNNTAIAGSTQNLSAWQTILGIGNASTCLAGDSAYGSEASITSCELTGTFAGTGPNIPMILTIQSLPNDTTLWGIPVSW